MLCRHSALLSSSFALASALFLLPPRIDLSRRRRLIFLYRRSRTRFTCLRCCGCAVSPEPCLWGNGCPPSLRTRCSGDTKMKVWSLAMAVAFLLLGKMNLFPEAMNESCSFHTWIGVSLFLPILSCWICLLLLDLNFTILSPILSPFYLDFSHCARVSLV